jgi:serine/threonine-protein kinase
MDAARLEELAALPEAQDPDPRVLGRVLLRRGLLTRYQINQVAQGRGKDLNIGPYILLDRLGEGGMGQVFKARHRHMQRTVALKLIRKEKLLNEASVKRFYQEVQAAAKLHHPNIVVAYDAGPAGSAHYFAMEYVEGKDLSRVVADSGPLPVARACEYVRQAAVGLQHANERGLVHRDIKPANLLVGEDATGKAVVKILDLGLARLNVPGGDGEKGLTQTGHVMGTPDYLAPEQALDARLADVRSDLYSLGCTFYFLLTGRPPFSGDSIAQVLLKHQMAEPEAPAGGWGDVPDGVRAVLRKLLAKKPEDRFQTPQELVDALAPLGGDAPSAPPVAPLPVSDRSPDSAWQTLDGNPAGLVTAQRSSRRKSAETTDKQPSSSTRERLESTVGRRTLLLIAAAVVCLGGLAGGLFVGVVLLLRSGAPTPLPQAGPGVAQSGTPATNALLAPIANTSKAPAQLEKNAPRAANPGAAADRVPQPDREANKVRETPSTRPRLRIVTPPPTDRPLQVPVEVPTQSLNAPVTKPTRWLHESGSVRHVTVAVTPDGHYGLCQVERPVLVDLTTGTELGFFPSKDHHVNSLIFTPDSRTAVATSFDGKVRAWAVPDGKFTVPKMLRTFDSVNVFVQKLAISPDGRWVAGARGIHQTLPGGKSSEPRGCGVTVWDTTTGHQIRSWDWPGEPVGWVAFSADGNRIFARRGIDKKEGAISVFDLSKENSAEVLPFPSGHFGMNGFYQAPDGRSILFGSIPGFSLWDPEKGMPVRQFPDDRPMRTAAWCSNRYVLIGGGRQVTGTKDWENCDIRVWGAQTGMLVRRLEGHNRNVTALAASADGTRVLSGCADGSVIQWDLPP